MNETMKRRSLVFKALSDEKRLRVLEQLKTGETCACQLIDKLEIPQSALSYHMKILYNAGIINKREEGKWTHYSISEQGSNDLLQLIQDIMHISNDKPCLCNSNCHTSQ